MASTRQPQSFSPSTDIASRRLPDLPPEAFNQSRISKLWASIKNKFSGSRSNSSMRRSQSLSADSSAGPAQESAPKELPYSMYNQLIRNHESIVLPGLRQYPPPIEDDLEPARPYSSPNLAQLPLNRNNDYDGIAIYEGASANASTSADQELPMNDYQDIDDLVTCHETPLRQSRGRKQKQPQMAALASSIENLHHQGWYWGPINREETEAKLQPLPAGSFLVRDSNDAHHLYTLSFKRGELILHTRIEFVNGLFTFFLSDERAKETGKPSVEELITSAMLNGVKGEFGDSRRVRGRPAQSSIKIVLTQPVSRFNEVRSLQFLCKFVLRANMNRENVPNLPLPSHVKTWVHEKDYF